MNQKNIKILSWSYKNILNELQKKYKPLMKFIKKGKTVIKIRK